ncbi:MAG: serpin family protein [Saprospiraceae bacterium]
MKNVIFLLVFAISCSQTSEVSYVDDTVEADIKSFNNDFAFLLFDKESLQKGRENILISPFSIQTALSMAANGASGNTLLEMKDFFGFGNETIGTLNASYVDLLGKLQQASSANTSVLSNNSFFYDNKRLQLLDGYKSLLEDQYNCHFKEYDFDAIQPSVDAMNGWIKETTNGKIDKLISTIKQDDIAFLINTLFFKAGWSSKFYEPRDDKFTNADGTIITTPFIYRDAAVPYYKGENYEIADVPFRDSTFSLSVVKPTNKATVIPFSKSVYDALLPNLKYDRLFIGLPKMHLSYKNDLVSSLKLLNIKDAFNDNADFTKLGTASNTIYISQIQHQAVLEVDEEGVEGAAATAIGFAVTSAPPSIVYNEPFYLILRHIETNTILFIGKVNQNPLGN